MSGNEGIEETERAIAAMKHPYSSFQLPGFQRWIAEHPQYMVGLPTIPVIYCASCGARRDPVRTILTCERCGAPQRSE